MTEVCSSRRESIMAAADAKLPFEEALDSVVNSLERKFALKGEQHKEDILALLPTGFGKSLIYQLAPLVAKLMGVSEKPVVAVVSSRYTHVIAHCSMGSPWRVIDIRTDQSTSTDTTTPYEIMNGCSPD